MKYFNKYIRSCFFIILLILGNCSTTILNGSSPTKVYFIIKSVFFLLLIREFYILTKKVFYNVELPNNFKAILLSVVFVFTTILSIDFTFTFIPRSHGVGYTYASRIWQLYYQNPINSLGFRDKEPLDGINNIFFVGDSFTEGHGLKNVDDRFSNIFAKKNANYNVINIGKSGADTKEEFEILKKFIIDTKIKPKKIILQYYGNDMDKLAYRNGIQPVEIIAYKTLNYFYKHAISSSSLLNYIYWLYPSFYTIKQNKLAYRNFLTETYNNSLFFSHLREIDNFIEYSKKNSVELIVIVFPILGEYEFSKNLYENKILQYLKNKNIKVINTSPLISKLPTEKVVVSSTNAHPSAIVNKIVADTLINIIDFKN